jgi:GT2 family glycosyltransferase
MIAAAPSTEAQTPRVTLSLVTYDGARWIPGCLASLTRQDLPDFELLICDNASTDGSQQLLGDWVARDPRLSLHESPINLGYAAAHNRAIFEARGEVIVLVNQDCELDEGFLSAVVSAFERHPEVASVQPRLRQLSAAGERLPTLDSTGLVMGRDRRAVSRAQGLADGPEHQQAAEVWGADGPAPAYRTSALLAAALPRGDGGREVLDEAFFLYKEDVDLAWRLRSLGWSAWYEPAALGWHARGTGVTGATGMLDIARTNRGLPYAARKRSWVNQRLMLIKNEDRRSLRRDWPWIAMREALSVVYVLFLDPRRLSAVLHLVRLAPLAFRKRRALRLLRAAGHPAGTASGG